MCGICGEINFKGKSVSSDNLRRMAQVMSCRGPDASGIFIHDRLGFAHRHLKIMDASSGSEQPMLDPALGLGIVYNGAVYNYPQIKKELEALGHQFFSCGDTEVILKAYAQWGLKCVKKFNGMFAFAIWERDSGKVILARDRLGIKPLYYSRFKDSFRFASSLPALLQTDCINTQIDPAALHYYFTFHSVVPAPHTILQGVRKLPPATAMTIDRYGSVLEHRYWTLKACQSAFDPADYDAWEEKITTTLKKAVQYRLVADVPVGVLLSGGVDSSLVTGLLAEAGQKNLETFSIGFESSDQEQGDEFRYSDIIANTFGTKHHKLFIQNKRLLPSLKDCVRQMSEPMVSHDVIAFYLLSQEVSKYIKVVQSGQGADEIFGGYHWYPPLTQSDNALEDYQKYFFDRNHQEYCQTVVFCYQNENYSRDYVRNHFAQLTGAAPVDQALHLDSTVMLVDDPVKRVDNMTMGWGLEARVPFLDHELVECVFDVPWQWKVRDRGKYILKNIARKIIPAEVIDRPKGYFPVPGLKHLQGNYLEFVREILRQPQALKRGLVDKKYQDRLIDDPLKHMTPLRGSKLWQVALLEFWLQVHGIESEITNKGRVR